MLDIASLLVASAHAQSVTAGTIAEASGVAGILPFLLIVVVFYFFVIRPQSTRFKQHTAMVKGLKKGDRVVTGGGIIGKVVKSEESSDTVLVEIAPGVAVEVSRATITALAIGAEKKTGSTPAPKGKKAGEKENIANDN